VGFGLFLAHDGVFWHDEDDGVMWLAFLVAGSFRVLCLFHYTIFDFWQRHHRQQLENSCLKCYMQQFFTGCQVYIFYSVDY
jgi:hypothetical protein